MARPRQVSTSTVKKSAPANTARWAEINSFQVVFWQRFGAGILISLIDGAVQAAVQSASHAGGTVVYAPSASQDVLTEVFKDTVHIAPTVTKKNGERIQILVARDVDFRSVYELHAAAAR